jgi:large subunit ribosomal protein L4
VTAATASREGTRTDRQVDVRTPAGGTAGSATLPGELFDVDPNVALIHQVVVAQLAAARQGTHATKTRGMVSGGGAKPYRQKGTGRARQGSTRAPQFTGGGTVHGPQPRDYAQRTPKKMKAAALRGALSDRARENRVHVVSTFVDGDSPRTKTALAVLTAVTTAKKVLVVLERDDVLNWVSLRNLPQVHLLDAGQLNTYDVLNADEVIFTEAALSEFVGRKPDVATKRVPGGVPSIAPAQGEGTVETAQATSPVEGAPAKRTTAKKAATKKATAKKATTKSMATTAAPAKKATESTAKKAAPAKKAAAPEDAAPATPAEAAKAPATKAAAANAGPDATPPSEDRVAPTEDGTTDASTEEKA